METLSIVVFLLLHSVVVLVLCVRMNKLENKIADLIIKLSEK